MTLQNSESDVNVADVTERLQQTFGTKVTLRPSSGGAGRIEIEYYSSQELDRLVELLLGQSIAS